MKWLGKIVLNAVLKNRIATMWLVQEIVNNMSAKDAVILGLYVRRRILNDRN